MQWILIDGHRLCSAQLYSAGKSIPQRNVINVFGLFVVMFVLLILYLVSSPDYERGREENSEHLPLRTGEEISSYQVSQMR
jgi:hypothetical protein